MESETDDLESAVRARHQVSKKNGNFGLILKDAGTSSTGQKDEDINDLTIPKQQTSSVALAVLVSGCGSIESSALSSPFVMVSKSCCVRTANPNCLHGEI